jgi:toxin-antitoxin system antitoxin component
MTDEERNAIVRYRMDNASGTLREVLDHCESGYYNTAVNRIYYACYYAASALLIANGFAVKSHDGVRQMLGKEFVLTGKIPIELGKFYSIAFSKRSSGDYEDFVTHDRSTVENLYPQAERFVKLISILLSDYL